MNVTVLDINDNKPELTKSFYEITIQEHTVNGTVIGKVEGFDKDQVCLFTHSPQSYNRIVSFKELFKGYKWNVSL